MGIERVMCTIVLLRRPGHGWPLVLAANRDEMGDRAWLPPGRHWPDRADVVAGRDERAGGTWLGVNDAGVVAAVSNRRGSLGPDPDKRSRGELPLLALAHGDAGAAARAVAEADGAAYRSFNLVVADRRAAFWLRNRGNGEAIAGSFHAFARRRRPIRSTAIGAPGRSSWPTATGPRRAILMRR